VGASGQLLPRRPAEGYYGPSGTENPIDDKNEGIVRHQDGWSDERMSDTHYSTDAADLRGWLRDHDLYSVRPRCTGILDRKERSDR
jgi:hypothetical protein